MKADGNISTMLNECVIYSDKTYTKKIGRILTEQIFDKKAKQKKVTTNIHLRDGVITTVYYMDTDSDGIYIPKDAIKGPVVYGTGKYMTWTALDYFFELIVVNKNIRNGRIFKRLTKT